LTGNYLIFTLFGSADFQFLNKTSLVAGNYYKKQQTLLLYFLNLMTLGRAYAEHKTFIFNALRRTEAQAKLFYLPVLLLFIK